MRRPYQEAFHMHFRIALLALLVGAATFAQQPTHASSRGQWSTSTRPSNHLLELCR